MRSTSRPALPSQLRPLRVAITSGDSHGIGPEVVSKALRRMGPQKNVHFFLWRNSEFPKRDFRRIQREFKVITVGSWAEALAHTPSSPRELIDICGTSNSALWVEEAARGCYFKHLDALATAPLSKPSIKEGGLKDLGHTEILKRVAQVKNAYMVFLGDKFNVFIATGHLPVKDIAEKITKENIMEALRQAQDFTRVLASYDKKGGRKPIGVLGLNPHAGDSGLIGLEDAEIISPLIESLPKDPYKLVGPIVPDVAFMKSQWEKYSLYVAMYHDQGLIPFKTIHGQNGVHLTWGLPFIRTSVDHGTAFDIAGKDKADETSMYLALKWAIKLAKGFYES